MDAVTPSIAALCCPMKVMTVDIILRISVVEEMTCFITGCNFSPSSTAISVTRFLALSSSAWTVVFCTLNSFVTDVPSSKAFAASSCSHFTVSRFPASAEMTCAARAPFSPISLNTGASASMLPILLNVSNRYIKPSLVDFFSSALNLLASIFVAERILSFCLNMSIISFERAVADISTACPWLSRTAANPIICGIDICACEPTPAIRFANSAR